jgi:Response regulator of the LytR/AlgR family
MQLEIKIDSSYTMPKMILLTDKITDEVRAIIKKLSDEKPQLLCGFLNDTVELLEQAALIRVYASSGKIFAVTSQAEYLLKLRLYELEERLDKNIFVRISNSEIINLKNVKNFDLSFVGTICVTLSNGTVTYVSRRYVTKIKQLLGI